MASPPPPSNGVTDSEPCSSGDCGIVATAVHQAAASSSASSCQLPPPPQQQQKQSPCLPFPSHLPEGLQKEDILLSSSCGGGAGVPRSGGGMAVNAAVQAAFVQCVTARWHFYVQRPQRAAVMASTVISQWFTTSSHSRRRAFFAWDSSRWRRVSSPPDLAEYIMRHWQHMTRVHRKRQNQTTKTSHSTLSGRKRVRPMTTTTAISNNNSSNTATTNACHDYWKNYAQFWNWAYHESNVEHDADLPADLTHQDVLLGTLALRTAHVGTLKFGDLLQSLLCQGLLLQEKDIPDSAKTIVSHVTETWGGRFFGYTDNNNNNNNNSTFACQVLPAAMARQQVTDILKCMKRVQVQTATKEPQPNPKEHMTGQCSALSSSSSSPSFDAPTMREALLQATAANKIHDNDVLLRLVPELDHHEGTNYYRRILRHVLWDFMHADSGLYLARKIKQRVQQELGGCFMVLFRPSGWTRVDDPDVISLQIIRDLEILESTELHKNQSAQKAGIQKRKDNFIYPPSSLSFHPTKYDVFIGLGRFYKRGDATPPGNVRFLRMVRDRCSTFRRQILTLDDLARDIRVRIEQIGGRFFCRNGSSWCNMSSAKDLTLNVSEMGVNGMPDTRTTFLVVSITDTFRIMEQRMNIVRDRLTRLKASSGTIDKHEGIDRSAGE